MKDVPSHMMKFIRKITKKKMKEATEEEGFEKNYRKQPSSKQNRQRVKKIKSLERKKRKTKSPEHLTVEEKNKKMKKRTPIIRARSNKKQIRL